jgi:hypothetical protein
MNNKTQQLTLHAGLGAGTSAITGNDPLSGAVSGVVGEVVGEKLYGKSYLDETGTTATDPITGEVLRKGGMGIDAKTTSQIAGLAGGVSAIFTGNAVGLDDKEVADNIFSGQRIGKNAVENNLLYSEVVKDTKKENLKKNFGPRWEDPKTGKYHKEYKEGYIRRPIDHLGTDISAPEGQEIYSAGDGIVILNRNINGYGNTVITETITPEGQKVWALYGHMYELSNIPEGSTVLEGQPIGSVGNTGSSQGNHLHFGINIGDENGYYNNYKGWINPEMRNIGNYKYLKDTPYQQSLIKNEN